MGTTQDFQRAPQAPRLPSTPVRFILHFVAHYRFWYLAMVVLEAGNAVCSICLPYAVSQIIKAVTTASAVTRQVR